MLILSIAAGMILGALALNALAFLIDFFTDA